MANEKCQMRYGKWLYRTAMPLINKQFFREIASSV